MDFAAAQAAIMYLANIVELSRFVEDGNKSSYVGVALLRG
jgi:hypothetical protein